MLVSTIVIISIRIGAGVVCKRGRIYGVGFLEVENQVELAHLCVVSLYERHQSVRLTS
jgi:hypothetical protein